MYESPIHIYQRELNAKIESRIDSQIFEATMEVGVSVDKDELIKALRYDRDQYAKGYADGKKATSAWISVEERLPEQYGPFLIADNEGNMEVATWTKQFGWFSGCNRVKHVTHWMPLPEPPQMKGGE